MRERRWSDADRELMAGALYHACDPDPCPEWGILAERYPAIAGLWRRNAEPVLDALTAAGWAPLHRVTCYEVHGEGCHAPENVTLIYTGEHG